MSEEAEINERLLDKFLNMGLQCLPFAYVSQENNRLMLLYFIIGSYDIRGKINILDEHKENFIKWIYSQQLLPDSEDPEINKACCGFRGSPLIGNPWNPDCEPVKSMKHDYSHITNTYTALAVLKMLGDDYSKINKKAIINSLKYLQNEDGSFNCLATGSEYDLRFVYCACCICYLLDDWSGMNAEKTYEYILSCQNFDGAMGQYPGQESHGGSTYCGVASLSLLSKLNDIPNKDRLIRWLVERQITGFQGRLNKDPDTCYSWWVGASLKILGAWEFVDTHFLTSFHFSCQSKIGGFSKVPNVHPDVLHTYFSLCALQMAGREGMLPLNYSIGITLRALGDH